MSVTKVSKSEMSSALTEIETTINSLKTQKDSLKGIISQVTNYDGLDVSGVGSIINSNLDIAFEDLETVKNNMKSYLGQVESLDTDDFTTSLSNTSQSSGLLSSNDGTIITLPAGLGSVHTYMGWQCITSKSSNQYKLRESAGMNFDEEGFGKIGDRYVVATTTTFGNVGDYIDVVQEDGTVIKCIIGDIKSQGDEGCNKWGHNNGHCVVEFVVDKDTWYSGGSGSHVNPGTSSCHPEWNQNITHIVNRGNYFNTQSAPSDQSYSSTVKSDDVVNNEMSASQQQSSSISNLQYAAGTTTVTYTVGTITNNTGSHSTSSPTILNTSKVTISSGDPNIDVSKYSNNLAAGFEVTVGNLAYEMSDTDLELLIAIVAAESDKSYDDALAVITTILNRCESDQWNKNGGTPVDIATAPNQFVVYQHGSYKSYMNGRAPETVVTAVKDALAGVRNHKYYSFRSNGTTGYSSNMISPTGNRYK